MNIYTVTLEKINASKTRSRNADTNYLTFSIINGDGTKLQTSAKLGDMGHGESNVIDLINRTQQPSMGVGVSNATDHLEIANPVDPVIIQWAVVNRGHAGDQQAMTEITNVGDKLIEHYLGSGNDGAPTSMDDGNTTSMDGSGTGESFDYVKIVEWAFTGLIGILDANCDGGVIAQVIRTSAAELAAKTANGATYRKAYEYPGTNSAVGCGENSLYFMTYSITARNIPENAGSGHRGT